MLQQPLAGGRKAHGHRRRRVGTFRTENVGSHGLVREMILRHQPDDLATPADRRSRPRLLRCQFGAELRGGDWPREGACRTDVGVEVLQLLDEHGGSEGPVTADVDSSQKNHKCHAFSCCGHVAKDVLTRSLASQRPDDVHARRTPRRDTVWRSTAPRRRPAATANTSGSSP